MPAQREAPSPGEPHRLDGTAARQGAALGHMRYVLGFSVALGVIALAVIYFAYF